MAKRGMEINRREFIKGLGVLFATAVMPPRTLGGETAALPDLVLVKGKSPSIVTRLAIDSLGGMSRFISKGDVVVVKPNMAWDRTPEQAANTNPQVVKTIVELCFAAGAKQVKVFDNSCNDPRRCYVRSGIKEAAQEAGATVSYMEEHKFELVKIGGEVIKEWTVYREILEADKVINVPIAKHHSLTRLTMSLKNWLGAISGERSRLHQRINEAIVDLCLVFKPVLTVLDANRVLIAHGPQGGDLADVKHLGTVIAGTDQVAVDSLGAQLFGLRPMELGYLVEAHERQIGEIDLSKLRLATLET